jgi:polysaccharide export outer membrane protein
MKPYLFYLLTIVTANTGQLFAAPKGANLESAPERALERTSKAVSVRPGSKPRRPVESNAQEPALFDEASGTQTTVRRAISVDETETEQTEPSPSNFLPNTMDGLNDKRILTTGDKLSFKVIEDEGLPRSLTVTDSSEIDVPYIGRVSVVNKTCKQFALTVKRLLEKEYYYQATVIVGLDAAGNAARAASRGKVYVMGQVRSQGAMDIPADEVLTVTKAILRAGGFGPYANRKAVKLVHGSKKGPATKPTIIDCVEILDKGLWDKDVEVNPEDIITVPEKMFNLF